jgi:hypothetical protein
MSTEPFEIIAGPAKVYLAPTGSVFPDVDETPDPDDWTDLGDTKGGVSVSHDESIKLLRVDQSTGPVKAIRDEESLIVAFALADLTLENYALILNNVVVSIGGPAPADRNIPLRQGFDVAEFAMLIRGPSPYMDGDSQFEIPVVVQTGKPKVVFVKDDEAVLDTEWNALEDPNSQSDDEKFGILRARDNEPA